MVLSHAVLEEYFEGICLEVVDAGIKAFKTDDRPRTSLLALLSYAAPGSVPAEFSGGPWGLRTQLTDGRQVLRQWAENNNGVKAKDLLRLLLPAGLKESDMGSAWLQHMDELGEMRGAVAHHGNPAGAKSLVDPGDALNHVERVLPTISRLDSRLCALRDE